MIDWTMIFGIWLILMLISIILLNLSKKKKTPPIAIMMTYIKCEKCGAERNRPFQRGDYVFGKGKLRCLKCGDDTMVIQGIYYEMPKTEEQIKYEELVRKWQ